MKEYFTVYYEHYTAIWNLTAEEARAKAQDLANHKQCTVELVFTSLQSSVLRVSPTPPPGTQLEFDFC